MGDVTSNHNPLRTILNGMTLNILGGKITATTTAAKIPTTPLEDRKSIMLRNDSGQTAFIGNSTVTTGGAYGMLFKNGETISLDMDEDVDVYVVLASGTGDVYFLEAS